MARIYLRKTLVFKVVQTILTALSQDFSVRKVVRSLFLATSNVVDFAHVVDSVSLLILKHFSFIFLIKLIM